MKVNFETNFDAIGVISGAIEGLSATLNDPVYLEAILKRAHNDASLAFDRSAAATAATGNLSHMYEYGVAGITDGQSNIPDPTSEAARLWVHTMIGQGGMQEIGFSFRPAIVRNPRPSTARYGVASKYIAKLSRRKYIFRNKAMVIETGQNVEITPKNGGLIFVPFYGEQQTGKDPRNRGYQMYPYSKTGQPIRINPGRTQMGSFTKFWDGWWGTQGSAILSGSTEKSVTMDVQAVIDSATARADATSVKPASSVLSTATRAAKLTKVEMTAAATKRRRDRK